jgi:hypothetical protein
VSSFNTSFVWGVVFCDIVTKETCHCYTTLSM